ncbi:MAG: hypothetical protein KKF33_07135 [Alphaproteobacteria bacterium]|jgi:hypothetical protein|nr:hypothetical protein [Alphaproteobacteria bacterium]
MFQPLFGAALLALALSLPAHAEFPREGVPSVANGQSSPFVGAWSIGFPEGDGMINGAPPVSCEAPVMLQADGEYDLVYVSPGGQEVAFALMEFSGRTTWLPAEGESLIAVWTGPDEFFSYTVELTTGRARWDDPRVYRRCADTGSPG